MDIEYPSAAESVAKPELSYNMCRDIEEAATRHQSNTLRQDVLERFLVLVSPNSSHTFLLWA